MREDFRKPSGETADDTGMTLRPPEKQEIKRKVYGPERRSEAL